MVGTLEAEVHNVVELRDLLELDDLEFVARTVAGFEVELTNRECGCKVLLLKSDGPRARKRRMGLMPRFYLPKLKTGSKENSLELELKNPPVPDRVGKLVKLLEGADVKELGRSPEFDDREDSLGPGFTPVDAEALGDGATPSPMVGATTGTLGLALIPRVPESTVVTPAGDFSDCGATGWGRVWTPTIAPVPSTM